MTYERFHATFVGVVTTLVGSVVVAELTGYWLHRLLHSDRFPGLTWGKGYRAAIERYGLDETELVSLRRCSEALFSNSDKHGNRSQEPSPPRPARR